MDDDEEKSFCYIEGTVVDKNAAEEVSELHENVWYRMKPPKQKKVMYAPFVSARQIDLVRNMLLGRTALKVFDYQAECQREKEAEAAAAAAAAAEAAAKVKATASDTRRDAKEKPCLKLRKSSVKFLNENAYDDIKAK